MVESFLSYIQYEKRSSQHTVVSYQTDLNQLRIFVESFNPDTRMEELSYPHLRSWIVSLVEAGLNPRSVNRKIASLRAYYKFLLKKEVISKDPTSKIKLLKTQKQLPHFVQQNELETLLNNVGDGDFTMKRDRLVLEMLYGTGIRLSELVTLKHAAIKIFDGIIKVTGKRNKERVIPVNKGLAQLLTEYYQLKKFHFGSLDHDFLIVTNEGKPAYAKFIYRVVTKYLAQIPDQEKKNPHVLRHTFATHLLNNGADLNAIKDLLGHTSLAATQVYTHNSLEKLKNIFDQAHPKA